MGRVRTCGERCHHAKGTRCACFCQGFFHGSAGAVNRQALSEMSEEETKKNLGQHGFKKGETVYIEQKALPLEVESAG